VTANRLQLRVDRRFGGAGREHGSIRHFATLPCVALIIILRVILKTLTLCLIVPCYWRTSGVIIVLQSFIQNNASDTSFNIARMIPISVVYPCRLFDIRVALSHSWRNRNIMLPFAFFHWYLQILARPHETGRLDD
jgi:ABC-type transport system involved in multi-copper enzyme maturation permease subunit